MSFPIIGELSESQRAMAMQDYVVALGGQLELHKINIRDCVAKLDRAYSAASESKKLNGVYVEAIQGQMATHSAAISQITGTLALLLCSGVMNIPGPTNLNHPEENVH